TRQDVIEQHRRAAAEGSRFLADRPGNEALARAARPLEMDIAGARLVDGLPQPVHDPVRPEMLGLEAAEGAPLESVDIGLGEAPARPALRPGPGGHGILAAAGGAPQVGQKVEIGLVDDLPPCAGAIVEEDLLLAANGAALRPEQRAE